MINGSYSNHWNNYHLFLYLVSLSGSGKASAEGERRRVMKKFIVLAMILIASVSYAAPFLVCDPQSGVIHYNLTGPAWVPASTLAQTDGSIKLDVAGSNVGLNSLTVAACISDGVWGEQCSVSVPFDFTRPTAPTSPSGIGLKP